MTLYLRLAWRNFWRHSRRTAIIVLSIAMTLGLMMWYDGLVTGFEDAIYGSAIRVLGGNIQVHAGGYQAVKDENPLVPLPNDQAVIQAALAQPNVVAASRRINTGGMITSREGAFAVSIVGVEPEKELPVNLVAQEVSSGRYLTADDQDVIYIGKGLADAMEVAVGDRVTLVGQAAHEQLRQRTMTVVGVYDIGMGEIEKRSIYMSLAEAQDLYGMGSSVSEVIVTLEKIGQEAPVVSALQAALPEAEIASWETNFPELVAALTTKGGVMDIFGVIMLMVAGIGILNLLLMAVYERTREIGLLGAMGLKPRQISLIFLTEGAVIGLVGVAAGVALGLLINIFFGAVGLDYSQFASLTEYTALINDRIYPSLGLEKVGQRTLTAIIISILAAYFPARAAAQHEPAEALHYV
ncbi:MAG: ABC transporter permease [Anaerolineales bacterium]|nr:ABC transporter permease [Anaerolineales bacterium]